MKIKHAEKERMIRLGPLPEKMKINSDDDIFLSRLKLLIIMTKSYLKGNPLGKFRKQAIVENANIVFYRSLQRVSESAHRKYNNSDDPLSLPFDGNVSVDNIFYKEIQLLAVMVNIVAENRPMDRSRKNDIKNHLNKICTTLLFNFKINDMGFLKVA
jgi:hypothetical protein